VRTARESIEIGVAAGDLGGCLGELVADLPSLVNSLDTARYVLEMLRRTISEDHARRLLDRIGNRLTKMLAQLRRIGPAG